MDFNKYSYDRIELLVDRAVAVRKEDEDLSDFLLSEVRSFTDSMDSGDELLKMTYHRYASDSFGVAFEIDHGDPELMFGGV